MKTTEQIKSEVVNYLNQTSNHLFVTTKDELYKVIVEGDYFIVINGDKVSIYNINDYVSWYGNNAKCVVKHNLFLIPSYTYPEGNVNKLKSIKNFKTMRVKIDTIKQAISGKTDKNEIVNIVKSLNKSLNTEEVKYEGGFIYGDKEG